MEPQPGVYDDAYLGRVKEVVEQAEKYGIYVFLDMHQDLYSVKFIDGAPVWATLDEGLPHPVQENAIEATEEIQTEICLIQDAEGYYVMITSRKEGHLKVCIGGRNGVKAK